MYNVQTHGSLTRSYSFSVSIDIIRWHCKTTRHIDSILMRNVAAQRFCSVQCIHWHCRIRVFYLPLIRKNHFDCNEIGRLYPHPHTHTYMETRKNWKRKKCNPFEYTSTTFQKEFASNAIENTMTANKKSALAIELKRLLCSSHSCTLFACLFSYLRLEKRYKKKWRKGKKVWFENGNFVCTVLSHWYLIEFQWKKFSTLFFLNEFRNVNAEMWLWSNDTACEKDKWFNLIHFNNSNANKQFQTTHLCTFIHQKCSPNVFRSNFNAKHHTNQTMGMGMEFRLVYIFQFI